MRNGWEDVWTTENTVEYQNTAKVIIHEKIIDDFALDRSTSILKQWKNLYKLHTS